MLDVLRDRRNQALLVAGFAVGLPALLAALAGYVLHRLTPAHRKALIVPVSIGASHVMAFLVGFAFESPDKALLFYVGLYAILLAWLYARPNYYSLGALTLYEAFALLNNAQSVLHASHRPEEQKALVLTIVLRLLVAGTALYAVRQIKKAPSQETVPSPLEGEG